MTQVYKIKVNYQKTKQGIFLGFFYQRETIVLRLESNALSWSDTLYVPLNIVNTEQKLGLGVSKKRKSRRVKKYFGKIWCSDLVEMQQFRKWNKGYRYLLMVLDLFSKYGWIIPLKDEKGETVTQAFKTIFEENRKPQ